MEGDFRADFASRHIGPSQSQVRQMLDALGLGSLQELVEMALPESIRCQTTLDLPEPLSEERLLAQARRLASQNKLVKSHIGMGYYDCHTPSVIQRNILENPGWYTAYTPYQAEISQGRLEALLNFQTVVSELTALPVANASLLDEGTAAAEAMTMAFHSQKKLAARRFIVSEDVFPQTLEVMRTRAAPLGVELITGDVDRFEPSADVFAVFAQYPGAGGGISDIESVLQRWKSVPAITVVATDLLGLCVLRPPGEMGADIAVGSAQRFGVPMGFGGPHAAFLAARREYTRLMPGRLIGVSKDAAGRRALRMALQTREQHIRRERATSNICTAQVLLAVMAAMYAVYHGPEGLRRIAQRIHRLTSILAEKLCDRGIVPIHDSFFDTLRLHMAPDRAHRVYETALRRNRNLARLNDCDLQISLDETTTLEDVAVLLDIVSESSIATSAQELPPPAQLHVPERYLRKSDYLEQEVFAKYHSETDMLRYMWQLQAKDVSLTHSMIPLGSCTMKLNATTEMIPITWPEFAAVHPFAPSEQTQGYRKLIAQLEAWLAGITGFAAISVQPNAGSQGEYAGLLVIRRYHAEHGGGDRDICLIPSSAHGTNPASAVMAGLRVVVVRCDAHGNIDIEDLAAQASRYHSNLAALMITYPSTHGVFEESIVDICKVVHDHGGQVYMDGANLNALVGLCLPGRIGPDVCHLNLHKTFCIPHGGGGPGVGPLAVAAHLKDYLPGHGLVPECGPARGITAVSAAPWGSAGILPISWAYIAMMGETGLRRATQVAILNANYIAYRLAPYYRILYRGKNNLVAHECIVDLRPFRESAGITADDVAKRLIDFGFHAPTMSWPVAGTLMVEPTESESLQELDYFCDAMIAIREEIEEIEQGQADPEDNVLKNAPHSVDDLIEDNWTHGYPRSKASFPRPWVRHHKFWSPVGRVDNAFGDRNFVCTCSPMESY